MKINLSVYAGFCDGVKRAFEIVMDINMETVKKPVFVLGSLVHNPEVMMKVEEKGIKKIDRESFLNAQQGTIGTIIITAHGTGPDIFEIAKKKGIDVIDTTCPKVIKVQRLAQVYAKRGYKIVIFGDKDHKEVKGIDDWGGGKSVVISSREEIKQLTFSSDEKIAVLSQTTQNEVLYEEIGKIMERKYKNSQMIATTCHTTHFRQAEVKDLARDNEVVIIIGSKTSANSNRLYEISLEINHRSYFIETKKDINSAWFENIKNVGVTAGASTPSWVIEEVMKYLEGIE